jgi:signal transduction histidine kinase
MTAGGALSGREPPGPATVVHAGPRTRVTRVVLDGQTVIRKEPLGSDADRRLRQELAMLQRLRGVAGVAQLAEEAPPDGGSVVLADAGDLSLARLATPLAVEDLVGLALGLARAVAGMHARGVMHRNICPANVVVGPDGAPCLVDFGLATGVAEIRPEFTHASQIVGELAYLAPEQTGRTGRVVDERSDLYALGATLYEVVTGAPPFGWGDPLRLLHDHLTRVPVAPAVASPAVPEPLSKIILHLLEKEPDRRYQTADGLAYDLERVIDAGAAGRRGAPAGPAGAEFQVGTRDVPLRLVPPSRLVGRDEAGAALEAAFEDALSGGCQGVLVAGTPGVGKTALVDRMRSVVTGRDGWFVAGKFDPYRRDLEFDAVHQSLRALGRLLLAEPDDELADARERILRALGPNAGLITAVLPELAVLLAVPPEPGDPLTAQNRAQWAAVQVLRAVASRKRPVLLFLDDLQWAGRTPLGVVDLVLRGDPVEGLLLVGAHREVDAAHPLAVPLARWGGQSGVRQVWLEDLTGSGVATMAADMLHLGADSAAGLAGLIAAHTRGNPYETVELLNGLRQSGVLTATAAGWHWDAAAVRAYLDAADPARLLAGRMEALPVAARQMVDAMACFGGRAELDLLATVTGAAADEVEQQLEPALDEGLLVAEPGARAAVRFRHDRIRETVLAGLDAERRRELHLVMARRLSETPEWFAVAAEQYLPVVDEVTDAAEGRRVVGLLRRAADQAGLIGDYTLVSGLLAAAVRLVDPDETGTLVAVRAARHAALYSAGRLDEADEEYRAIGGLGPTAAQRADAAALQVHSLTHRIRFAEAIALGVESLRQLGIAVPTADRISDDLDRQVGHLHRWLERTDGADELTRPEITDPTLLATVRLLHAIQPVTYFGGEPDLMVWIGMEVVRIWSDHGPARDIVGPASHAAFNAVTLRSEAAAAWLRALRRMLTLGDARGYEPGTSEARFLHSLTSWRLEPIENGVEAAQRARDGLIAGGDLANAGYTYQATVRDLVDCAPSLDTLAAEVQAGLAFARRTGNEHVAGSLDSYRWFIGALRGENPAGTELIPAERHGANPLALFYAHATRAIAAAVFGDAASLERHTAAAMPVLQVADRGSYSPAMFRLLRGLALADQARAAEGDDRDAPLAELDELTRWLAARAVDAPANFGHLLRLLEAERAWTVGDFHAAALAFDTALREVAHRQRPWHRGVTAEHAARFHLAHGLDHTGHQLLAQARQHYAAWGATAKVAQLDWAYPTLRPVPGPSTEPAVDQATEGATATTVTSGTIDMLGILSASQALSSETTVERLHTRVAAVLGAMTGATGVRLLLWSDDQQDWWLPTPDGGTIAASGTGHEHAVPTSLLRYAQRVREPVVVADAVHDDRFARDAYFADLACCSVLALPILNRGTLQALLVLENRLIRGAFTAERLDAVQLIAGQLAASLDNAQLYAELTKSRARIVTAADQTRQRIERDLHDGAQQRLVSLTLQLRTAQADIPPELEALDAQLDRAVAEANGALDELREIARGLHPGVLARGGLGPAVRALARRCPIPVDLAVHLPERLPEHVEVSAYYVVAEALTNAAKHARASTAAVTVEASDTVLRLTVDDDGVGGADLGRGTGLLGLKDRVEAIGGRIRLDSPPGAGTSLQAQIPLTAAGSPAPRP